MSSFYHKSIFLAFNQVSAMVDDLLLMIVSWRNKDLNVYSGLFGMVLDFMLVAVGSTFILGEGP